MRNAKTRSFYLTPKSMQALKLYAIDNGHTTERNGDQIPNLSAALDAILAQLNQRPALEGRSPTTRR